MKQKQMKVLLSIKPKFAEKIFNGTKKYEFRKAIFKNEDVKTVIVYSSSPVMKVIGEFEIENISSNTPKLIWKKTKNHSGISKVDFFKYFIDRDIAFAIKIKKVKKYKKPLSLKEDFKTTAPQSFKYIG